MKNNVFIYVILSSLVILCMANIGCGSDSSVLLPTATPTASPTPSGNASISGFLLSYKGRLPISDATVQIKNRSTGYTVSTQTELNGYYIISNVPAGQYTYREAKTNYIPKNGYTELIANRNTTGSGILVGTSDMVTYPYDPQYGYVLVWIGTANNTFNGLGGVSVSCSPNTYNALGYVNSDFTINWQGSSTVEGIGAAIFAKVSPGDNCIINATKTGYTFQSQNIPVIAGEFTQVNFIPQPSGSSK